MARGTRITRPCLTGHSLGKVYKNGRATEETDIKKKNNQGSVP